MSMDKSCFVSTVQASDGNVMAWENILGHIWVHLVSIKHYLNATAYLGLVTDHVLTMVPASSSTTFRVTNKK